MPIPTTPNKLKYILRPGKMLSKHDRQVHYISAEQLASLYQVDPAECVTIHPGEKIPPRFMHLEILAPRYDGKYFKPI